MPKKILIARFSSIGDIVLCTPIIRCLKEQLHEVELHFITKEKFASLLAPNPYLTKIHHFKKEITECYEALEKEKFDYIIDLHKNLRSFRLRQKLKCKAFTFPKLNIEKWVIVNFKLNLLPKLHIVERYFKAVSPLGVSSDNKGLDFFIPPDVNVDLQEFGINANEPFLAYAFGGNHKGKLLPDVLAEELLSKISLPTLLLGGPEDKERGERLTNKASNTVNLAGKLSLFQSAAVLQKAQLVLAHDTGLMHIAAAFQKPIISVWGGTSPVFGMYPYMPGPNSKMIIAKNALNPSSKLGKPTLMNPNPMKNISVKEIAAAIAEAS